MLKFTVTIEEVPEKKSEKESEIKDKYIISNTAYSSGDAFIYHMPCKVITDKYLKEGKWHIKVVSCITGIEYEIPYKPEWLVVYDKFEELLGANHSRNLLCKGYYISSDPVDAKDRLPRQLVGKKYYPIDNSRSEDFDGNFVWVANTSVEIVSIPFDVYVKEYKENERFVLVKTESGKIAKCLFREQRIIS